jgi:acyl-CoA synthetase (NDP forming)
MANEKPDRAWLFYPRSIAEIGSTYFLKRPAGRRMALTWISGGLIVNYTDVAVRHGFEIPEFAPDTKRNLSEVINAPGTSFSNPIDMVSRFFTDRVYAPMLGALDKDTNWEDRIRH